MKKISRHDGPFGRRNCCVRSENNTRRERKWITRMQYEPRSRSIRGNAWFWMLRGTMLLLCVENGIEAPPYQPNIHRAKRRAAHARERP